MKVNDGTSADTWKTSINNGKEINSQKKDALIDSFPRLVSKLLLIPGIEP
jgi:hypothetical protein